MLERALIGNAEFKFDGGGTDAPAMSFKGYGAIFNNVDRGGDIILPGAFEKSLAVHAKAGTAPDMYLQHDAWSRLPIGLWDAVEEDSKGLKCAGHLIDTSDGTDVYKAMKAGAVKGLSIGYYARKASTDEKTGIRTISEVELIEISVVNRPMNPKALVTAVKGLTDIHTIREFEDFLRDAGGFSRAEAKAIAASGFKSFDAGRDAGGGAATAAIEAAQRLVLQTRLSIRN